MRRPRLVEDYKRALGMAIAALREYGDPDFYHAVAIIADRPAGAFADDFSRDPISQYNRPMPGKLARETLMRMADKFPNLKFTERE